MRYFEATFVFLLFSILALFHGHIFVSVDHGNDEALAQQSTGDVAVSCGSGSSGKSTARDGREWIGKSASGESKTSTVVAKSFGFDDPVPYFTSTISALPFYFTFQVNPGQKFIRFHFYPAPYCGFEKSFDLFTVKAGPFILSDKFSPTLTCAHLGVKFLVKEFCINVEQHGVLNITFTPVSGNHMAYAFVNGIEIVSMPTGLYYTLDGDLGAPIVGQNYRLHSIDNRTALEMVERLNIGGSFISPVEDFGMFRRWNADASYFQESGVSINYMAPKLASANNPLYIAPPKVYQTSWKTVTSIQLHNCTWKIPISLGFGYLVRLHFCDHDALMTDEFSILINNQIAEVSANVMRWSGGTEFPVYKDFVVMARGYDQVSENHLVIVLQSVNGSAVGLLKGMEIFKLSNLDNSFGSPTPASLKKVTAPSKLSFFSLLRQSNVNGTCMTITILILSTTVYCLRIIWGGHVATTKKLTIQSYVVNVAFSTFSRIGQDSVHDCKDAQSTLIQSSQYFSLADIKLATQSFSDDFLIGKSGFGKVYKGIITGVSDTVAIQRLSFFPRKGARKFWAKIEKLSKLRHVNLVSLIGYCYEDGEMILIYEYIPGGCTLADSSYKFAQKGKDCVPLSWEQRLRICIGAARGLEYLHSYSDTEIIHRALKDTNILLDNNLVPKISHVGLFELQELTQSKSSLTRRIEGIRGYLDSHYLDTHTLTRKSDVYYFGIVMLVVISGRPALDTTDSLLAYFQECILKEEFYRIVDPHIYKDMTQGSLNEFVGCVKNCLQQKPESRPSMAQLVGSLEHVLQLQIPVKPASGDAAVELTGKKAPSKAKLLSYYDWEIGQIRETNGKLRPPTKGNGDGGLIFVEGSKVAFNLKDLLTASAELLGKGSCGDTYKVVLKNGTIVSVKRLSDVSVGKEEFEHQLKAVGRIHHENMLPLRAYYYSEEEKLTVYDYYSRGSVSALLHGYRGEKKSPLDWESRVQIAIGAARGIAHLHEESAVYGNLKASNIFLNSQQYGCISDIGLAPVMSRVAALAVQPVGYRAPEIMRTGKTYQPSDVYSFGILLLELVTGKSPVEDQPAIQSIVRQGWASELFDSNLLLHSSNDVEDMAKMVEIGIRCVATPVHRPKMIDVVKMLEDIRTIK